jgi:hypothetical protein
MKQSIVVHPQQTYTSCVFKSPTKVTDPDHAGVSTCYDVHA